MKGHVLRGTFLSIPKKKLAFSKKDCYTMVVIKFLWPDLDHGGRRLEYEKRNSSSI